jgi:hypothetical protein
MKIIAPMLVVAATLGGCAVVPVGRPVAYGPPMAVYPAAPPPVVVVPSRPYYGGYYGGYYGRRGYWR